MAQHRATGSEITPPYAPQSSRFGSELPPVEDDVDIWCYASCMPETTTTVSTCNVEILLQNCTCKSPSDKVSAEMLMELWTWLAGISLPRGWCILVCSLLFRFVTLWNYKVCENGKAMKHFDLEINHDAIASRKVCTCAPIFKFFYGPPGFSLRRKLIPKITISATFWHNRANLGLPWHTKFCLKNFLRGCNPFVETL